MSKKYKRHVRKVSGGKKVDSVISESQSAGRTVERGFNPDYSYVFKDLKRIGMLAGSFFIILIALSFFLR